MTYIPKRVLYGDFTEEGVYGLTARQALEAAIDGLIPAYHLILVPVMLYQYTRGNSDPLTKNFKEWGGLTVQIPLGVLYTLNFYPEHRFCTEEGKPTAVIVAGPLGTPEMRPEIPECPEYLLWPTATPVVFDHQRLFFLREDLERLAMGQSANPPAPSVHNTPAGQPLEEIPQSSHLLVVAGLLELLLDKKRPTYDQQRAAQAIADRGWHSAGNRRVNGIFAAAKKAAKSASSDAIAKAQSIQQSHTRATD